MRQKIKVLQEKLDDLTIQMETAEHILGGHDLISFILISVLTFYSDEEITKSKYWGNERE